MNYQTKKLRNDEVMHEDFVNEIQDGADWEDIFKEIQYSSDGDYIIQAQALAKMKPTGW